MKLLLLLLPAVALGAIEINLSGKVDFNKKDITGAISQKGFKKLAITDNDRVAFQIMDEELKAAIGRYHGKRPDDIIFTRDSPWGDLYNRYSWSPVEVKIETDTPVDMFEIKSEKVVLTRKIYENTDSATKKINIEETKTTTDTVTSLWNNPKKVAISRQKSNEVDIKLNFEVENEVAGLNHAYAFGSNRKTTAKKPRSQKGSLDLAPGQKVLAQLEAKKATLKFTIPYKVLLTGDVAVHYNNKYKDHYFYGLDINHVLGDKSLTVTQVLSYEFYYGQKLNIINAGDGYSVIKSFAVEGGTTSGQKRRASAAEHAAASGMKITKKALKVPFEFTEEELKSIVEDFIENMDEEASSESTEQESTEETGNKTSSEVPKSE